MDPLELVYESEEAVPEAFRGLYSEQEGKFVLTHVKGLKSQADVDRVTQALNHEKTGHKTTRDKLALWGELDPEETQAALARIPELEAQVEAGGGQMDEAKVNEIVEGRVRTKVQPIERQLAERDKVIETQNAELETLRGEKRTRIIHDAVREAMNEAKILPSAQEDVLLLAERVFEISEDGKVLVKDEVGAVPGADATQWLRDMAEKRPHWWPPSNGGGAGGSGGSGGGLSGTNPWTDEHWNMGEQGKILREKGREVAERMAKAANTTVGGLRPPARKG